MVGNPRGTCTGAPRRKAVSHWRWRRKGKQITPEEKDSPACLSPAERLADDGIDPPPELLFEVPSARREADFRYVHRERS